MERERAESLFLNCVLNDNDILLESKLTPDHFGTFRDVFSRLVKMASTGKVTKRDLLTGASEREQETIMSISGAPGDWRHYHKEILEQWAHDTLHEGLKRAMTLGYSDAVPLIEETLSRVVLSHNGARTKRLTEILPPLIELIQKGGVRGVPYGFDSIDKATGGAKPSQLCIIGARPSQGKSALMAHCVRNMARVSTVGVITIESDEQELGIRMMAGESGIDSRILVKGDPDPGHKRDVAKAGYDMVSYGDRVMIHDQFFITMSEVKGVCRKMARDGAKVIFIDYLQMIHIPGKATKREEVADVVEGLKALARELEVCMVALAQLSRDADDKRPAMGDIQHSSAAEQFADQILLIWHKRDSDGKLVDSRVIIDKCRNGMTRDVIVDFIKPIVTFKETYNESDSRPE